MLQPVFKDRILQNKVNCLREINVLRKYIDCFPEVEITVRSIIKKVGERFMPHFAKYMVV